ncbi:hypothetical protein ASPWEDRAFT_168378 [Aspergillus wentii DTO 134E9]|uniref:rRNA biogenesis protein RRP36 n=1 Tax=Aspergillus wentii DTO 134E9 TaxID=1073089 RepID=A0A1L9RU74_ASPWE|nr:uncharacterized protein ASPWEDRAFT_168378 [Aspergillus wentii DTO 134E9]KAI9934100.1 rRNA biogenesis protein rrp36 [Aspergillus wentii]OJJ38475.1 hypothetical protein ASPWEDRAFT_168378 [Aspergillus wentii DTO 134E9]
MAISDLLNRRVRARPEEDEDAYSEASDSVEERNDEISDDSEDEQDKDDASDGSLEETDDESNDDPEGSEEEDEEDQSEDDEDEEEGEEDNGKEDLQASLNNISFGALAKAQASMGPKGKKNRTSTKSTDPSTTASPLDDIRARIREAREQKRQINPQSKDGEKKLSRSSKHAPTVQSSKHAVSRKRTVIEPPAVPKSRDPRFDPTIRDSNRGQNPAAASKAYAFLDEYRASELKDLKEQMAKTKDPAKKEELKRAIRSSSDRMRTSANRKREQEIMAEHKKNEKKLLREGKKSNPYFLKKSDLKKQVMVKKYEQMGSRDRTKALERRRKKVASKERKEMPWERRGMEGDGEGRKRRRLE